MRPKDAAVNPSQQLMQLPSTNRAPLAGQHFQVAVIGGGIMGVAIARECARAGKRTLLVEQHDFAAGTTSRSSRILSGLRALERGDISFARESLRERQQLLRNSSHLARPAHFLMAFGSKGSRSALSTRTALWLYRRMAGNTADASGFEMERKKLERALDAGQRWSIFDYEDAQCEFPERLVAEWLLEAVAAGAVVRNHTQVMAVDVMHGRARGLLLRDWTRNTEEKIEATWVINATGPWADRTCQGGLCSSFLGMNRSWSALRTYPTLRTRAKFIPWLRKLNTCCVPWRPYFLRREYRPATSVMPSRASGQNRPMPRTVRTTSAGST
jgi:glycerol-3-phosphate dehydrogenase